MKYSPPLRRVDPLFATAAATLFFLLLLSLIVDHVPRFHLADSAVFIATRYGAFIPTNRSWSYGLVLGWILRSTGRIVSLPLCQIVVSWMAFTIFISVVGSALRLRWHFMLLLVLIGSLEPLGYYWSRSFMADSTAQSTFAVLSAVLISRTGLLSRFLLVLTLGFLLISFRVVYYPPILVAMAGALAFRYLVLMHRQRHGGIAVRITHDSTTRAWGAALAAFVFANLGYGFANTAMTRSTVLSTNIGDMEFLVGALSPLMGDKLANTPLTIGEKASLPPLTYENRLTQTFGRHGLAITIRHHFHSAEEARPVMRRLVMDTIEQHPVAVAKLALRQWSDYLNPMLVVRTQYRGTLSGAVPGRGTPTVLPDFVLRIFAAWKISPMPSASLPTVSSPALWYLESVGGVWSLILAWYATFGIFVVPFLAQGNGRTFLIFANCFSFLYIAMLAFASNGLVTRYLLPLDVPLLFTVAFCLSAWTRYPRSVPVDQLRPQDSRGIAPQGGIEARWA